MKNKDRARVMQRVALQLVSERGKWLEVSGVRVMSANSGPFLFLYRTPFNNPEKVRPARNYVQALGRQYGTNLPYGLDIYYNDRKVMNLEWDLTGRHCLVSYRRGPWEEELREMAA